MKPVKQTKVQKRLNGFMRMHKIVDAFIIFVYNMYKSIVNPIKSPVMLIMDWRFESIVGVPYEVKLPNVLVIYPVNIYNEWYYNKLPFNKGIVNGIKFYLWFYIMSGLCDMNKPTTPMVYMKHYKENPKIDTLFPYNELVDKDKANTLGINPLPMEEYGKHLLRYSKANGDTYYNDIVGYNLQDHLINIITYISNHDGLSIKKKDEPSIVIPIKDIFYSNSIHSIRLYFGYNHATNYKKFIIKNNDEFSSNMYINDCFYNQYFRFGFSDLLVKKNVYGKFIDDEMTILSIFIDVNFYYNEGFKIDTIPSIKDNHIISLNPDYEF